MRCLAPLILLALLVLRSTASAHETCPLHAAGAAGAVAPGATGAPILTLTTSADAVRIALIRPDGRPSDVSGAGGTLVVSGQGGAHVRATLAPAGDALRAAARVPILGTWTADVEVKIGSATERARFVVPRPALLPPRLSSAPADGTAVELTGEVVDGGCERLADAGGGSHVACARGGTLPVLRTAEGRLWTLALPADAPAETKARLARVTRRTRVTGHARRTDGLPQVAITTVVAEHDHDAAPHGGVVGMQGDRHLELVVADDGTLRLYVLDAFMTPVPVAGARGSAIVQARDGTKRTAAVAPAPDGAFLIVDGARRGDADEDVTVDVTVGGERIAITLPFAPR